MLVKPGEVIHHLTTHIHMPLMNSCVIYVYVYNLQYTYIIIFIFHSTFLISVRVELLNTRLARLKQSGFTGANRSVWNSSG